jgi:hypothetical protein
MVTLIAGSRSALPSCGSRRRQLRQPDRVGERLHQRIEPRLLAYDGELERRRLPVEPGVFFDEVSITARIAQ